jgi:uncharacterized protein (DUF2236 family)
MTAFELFNRPLAPAERDRYLGEQAVIGRMAGADYVPETADELEQHVEAIRPRLSVNAQTLEFFEFLLADPPGTPKTGPATRALRHFQVEAGLGLMPEWAGRMSGFGSTSLERRLLHRPLFRAYATALRWAYGGPPEFVRLATERALATPSLVESATVAR